jgi:hypothetical protein
MCNCNQKRATYTSANSPGRDAQLGMRQVRMVQKEALTITGDITGREYLFRRINDINWVDKRDLPYMTHFKGLIVLH